MHNLLNTAFKFLSRSLVVSAALFGFSFFTITNAQTPDCTYLLSPECGAFCKLNPDHLSCVAACKLKSDSDGCTSSCREKPTSRHCVETCEQLVTGGFFTSQNAQNSVCFNVCQADTTLEICGKACEVGSSQSGINTPCKFYCEVPANKTSTYCVDECFENSGTSLACKATEASCDKNPTSSSCKEYCEQDGANVAVCKKAQEAIDAAAASAAQQRASDASSVCVPFPGYGFDFKACFINILDVTIVSLAASFLQLCAYVFELSIQISIVQFSNLVTGSGTWLNDTWGIVRDVLNIGVIFVLLYAAIKVIVGRGDEIKKLIAGVILFGVMTNFSLFLTKAAVDITNVIALEFYQQMRTVPLSDAAFSGGLGASVVEITGLSNLYDPDPLSGGIANELKGTDPIRSSILFRLAMICVFVAVGLIFLQAAGLFILRTISLILLLIFSPLMFAGAIFSPLQKWIEQWHKEFLGQITVAPIFMIILYVVLTVTGSLVGSVRESLKSEADMFSFLALTLLTSAVIVFGFGAALTQAKKFAGSIGGVGAKWGGKLGGGILSGVTRSGASLTARLGQQTLGRAGLAAENGTGKFAKAAQFLGVNKLKDASFDVRNAPGASKVGSGVSRALSAATGASVSIDAGAGLGGRETRLAAGVEVEKKKKAAIQTKADTKIEDKFKKIDDNTKKYDITDAKIIDATTGAELVRTTEDDKEWEGLVKKANTKEKEIAQTKKSAYLTTLSTDSQATPEKGKAAFRAKKAAEEKLDKTAKATKDHEERKKKLKAFKEDLKTQFASDASSPLIEPFDGIKVAKTQAEIDGMTDQQVADLWESIVGDAKIEFTRFKSNAGASLNTPSDPGFVAAQKDKNNFEALIKRAENAKKTMESLKKAIDAHG